MTDKYDIDWFIWFFKQVPDDDGIHGPPTQNIPSSLLYYHYAHQDLKKWDEVCHVMNNLTRDHLPMFVANGKDEDYKQSTWRERVIAYLYDIKNNSVPK